MLSRESKGRFLKGFNFNFKLIQFLLEKRWSLHVMFLSFFVWFNEKTSDVLAILSILKLQHSVFSKAISKPDRPYLELTHLAFSTHKMSLILLFV